MKPAGLISTASSLGGGRVLDIWPHPATIQENHFVNKSLSNWAYNIAVGCGHACRFCYVPSAATVKQALPLAKFGIQDPDAEWGNYVLLRGWDEGSFLRSLATAERIPINKLARDGNRAVIFCSTTDPYQTFVGGDFDTRKQMFESSEFLVRRALELIRDHSTLRVRILTRSPLAKRDFDIFKSFGKRLLFGMSVPTLRADLAKVYEPRAPAPGLRLATLEAARAAGLNIFVAVAPTYPECDRTDLKATLTALSKLKPTTVFHEPINIRAENVERIRLHAESLGIELQSSVFDSRVAWKTYAVNALKTVQSLGKEVGLADRIHLWPDKSLGSKWVLDSMESPTEHENWLNESWNRVSEWP